MCRHGDGARCREELIASNRQRAKRMTVPPSSLCVSVILFELGLRSKACRSMQRIYSDKGCMREAVAVLRMTRLVERGDYITVLMTCRSVFLLGFNLAHEMEHFLNPLDLLCTSVETFVKRSFFKKEQFERVLDKPAVSCISS